ncbi:MAG: aldose epimerase [Oscillatoriales cyanobacterium RM2_1_1]|nr:aldose epimerase [Oscillatoriales cyanobacterium SM2_3_0]NJO46629.1 aldose epimerase [Oscillatoriales cyanobacterium RM2_1_1]
MAAIAVEQQQYKTYILSDGESQVQIVPERGGILTEWQMDGQPIFYLDRERFTDPALSVRGGIPLLFPICGNLVEDSYTLNGQSYSLKQHGFARTSSWTVAQQHTEAGASLTVSLKSNPETLASYPFEFELNYIYTLRGNTLELRFRHTNLSSTAMPFATGIHPYFFVSDKAKLQVELPTTQFKIKGNETLQEFSGTFDFSQEEIDYAFTNLTGQTATVIDQSRGLKLTLTYDNHYSTLVFWTVKGKDFYCLEPWTAPRNALNTGEALLTVQPDDTVETMISMMIELV